MKTSFFLNILILFCNLLLAQDEANIWYFGNGYGLDFHASSPAILSGSAMHTTEACAVASDKNGKLLFYTNGEKVFNRDHQLMPDGNIGGNISSTQILVLPKPGSEHLYYIFTPPSMHGDTTGYLLKYSIVDMMAGGGKGNVIVKDIILYGNATEKITAVKHCNLVDYWIITHERESDEFLVYRLTRNGIDMNPVRSRTGSILDGVKSSTTSLGAGQMKANNEGDMLANICFAGWDGEINHVELFSFNKENGTIRFLNKIPFKLTGLYGLEFSPDDRFLYVPSYHVPAISQVDLGNINPADTHGYRFTHKDADVGRFAQIQTGPDGKLYVASLQKSTFNYCISVINEPNIHGTGANVEYNKFCFSEYEIVGLPAFPMNVYREAITARNLCLGDTSRFSISVCLSDSIVWDFGHGHSTGITAKGEHVFHIFPDTGEFDLKAFVFHQNGIDTFRRKIHVKNIPLFNLGNDTVLCPGETLLLSPGIAGAEYSWNNTRGKEEFTVTEQGIYSARITKEGCSFTDTIKVTYDPEVHFVFSNTFLCPGTTTELTVNLLNNPSATRGFIWENTIHSNKIHVSEGGKYSFTYTSPDHCVFPGEVMVEELCPPLLHVPNAFSPDNNNINEYFSPRGMYIATFEMKIYNRWGEKIFESRSMEDGWNGTYKGGKCPAGVYLYKIRYSGINEYSEIRYLKGKVVLPR